MQDLCKVEDGGFTARKMERQSEVTAISEAQASLADMSANQLAVLAMFPASSDHHSVELAWTKSALWPMEARSTGSGERRRKQHVKMQRQAKQKTLRRKQML